MSLLVSQLTPLIHSRNDILEMCKQFGPGLKAPFILDKPGYLMALAGKESAFGSLNVPRYEPAYGPGGIYYYRSILLKDLYRRYGSAISSSWGPWQILGVVSIETLGFGDHPAELHDGRVSGPLVVSYLNYLYSKGADNIEKLICVFNAGLGCLTNRARWPRGYMLDFMKIYESKDLMAERRG